MTRHSSLSISPLWSVSRKYRAFLRRGGWSRNIRFSSPQLLINFTTSASFFMAETISSMPVWTSTSELGDPEKYCRVHGVRRLGFDFHTV